MLLKQYSMFEHKMELIIQQMVLPALIIKSTDFPNHNFVAAETFMNVADVYYEIMQLANIFQLSMCSSPKLCLIKISKSVI